jgi:hypothetical protein
MYSDISLEIFLLESMVKVTVRFCRVDWEVTGGNRGLTNLEEPTIKVKVLGPV